MLVFHPRFKTQTLANIAVGFPGVKDPSFDNLSQLRASADFLDLNPCLFNLEVVLMSLLKLNTDFSSFFDHHIVDV